VPIEIVGLAPFGVKPNYRMRVTREIWMVNSSGSMIARLASFGGRRPKSLE